jgi:NAD+ kinase
MGSTAYSYAAGGPVVSPGAEGILVTPSAPLNGIARSLLVGPNEPLRLELTRGRPAFELDGVLTGRLDPGAELQVEWRRDAGLLVRIAGSQAAARSRVKLSLLDLPLLPQELAELLPENLRPKSDGTTS